MAGPNMLRHKKIRIVFNQKQILEAVNVHMCNDINPSAFSLSCLFKSNCQNNFIDNWSGLV